MNYSMRLKEELIGGAPRALCCTRAYLKGLFINAAETRNGHVVVKLSSVAARQELARVYHRLYKKTALMDGTTMLFSSGELLHFLKEPLAFTCQSCALSYLRGAMIAAGTMSDPEKGYHFEIRVADGEGRERLLSICEPRDWHLKSRAIGTGFGVYSKNSGIIENILIDFDARNALFQLMNAKIRGGIRNEENRVTNCETKNISKAVNAAGQVIAAIAAIKSAAKFEAMPTELRETARLREENPDVSLVELAHLHNPAITKSGLYHRLQKITDFAKSIREKAE